VEVRVPKWMASDRVGYIMERPVAEKLVELLDDQGNIRASNA